MKKKAFTLVELLAVIIILGILISLVVPNVFKIMNKQKEESYNKIVDIINNSGDLYVSQHKTEIEKTVTPYNYITVTLADLTADGYFKSSLVDPRTNEEIAASKKIYIYYKNENTIAACFEDACNEPNIIKYSESEGVNLPQLVNGMTAVKWNSGTNTWDEIADPYGDTSWYDYTNKEWANAKTADGSMWVWIPRYVYKISSGWHSNTAGTIDVQFSMGTDDTRGSTVSLDTGTTSNASNVSTNGNKYTNHPAFTFGTTELTGIWVSKFDPTAAEGVANGYTVDGSCPITGDNVTSKSVKIVPNVTSWRCITANNAFTLVRSMEKNDTYGWGTSGTGIDTHMMKNIEWGALVYLSKSVYGMNTNQIWINPSDTYTTGCSGESATSARTTGCSKDYTTTQGKNSSTTGTIYGAYDIIGPVDKMIAAYVANGSASLTNYCNSILTAEIKYKDVYSKGSTDDQTSNYNLTINKKGDAIYETSNNINGNYTWFSDYAFMPYTANPLIARSGLIGDGPYGAGAFAFYAPYGGASTYYTFRPVLIVNKSL